MCSSEGERLGFKPCWRRRLYAMGSSMSPPSLTDLPDGVLDEILVRLPLREAVRTGVLSRAWRRRWHSIPELLLRGDLPVAAIDNVLLLHSAPVRRFSLMTSHTADRWILDRWILSLSRRAAGHLLSLDLYFINQGPLYALHSSVFSFRETLTHLLLFRCSLSLPPLCSFPALRSLKLHIVEFPDDRQLSVLLSGCPALEHLSLLGMRPCGSLSLSRRAASHLLSLDLFFVRRDPLYPLHSSVFSFRETLTHLALANCSLSLPPLCSFPALRSLQLERVEFPDDGQLSVLISGCPALEHLSLVSMRRCGSLRVHSPNLRSFKLNADCDRVQLMSGQTLHELRIDLATEHTDVELAELFRGVVCENKLSLQEFTVKTLAKGSIPDSMVTSFQRLRSLTMTVSLADPRQISVMLCLMRSAPNLQKLDLLGLIYDDDATGPGEDFWIAIQSLELFASLRNVYMIDIMIQEPDMEFMQFILAKAQVLETLTIMSLTVTTRHHESALTELRKFHRASTRAQIVYKE